LYILRLHGLAMLPSSLSFTFTKLEYDGGWEKEMGYVTERLVHSDKMSS